MKKKNLLLLSLIALSIVGCDKPSSIPSNKLSEAPISQNQNSKPSAPDKTSTNPSTSTSGKDTTSTSKNTGTASTRPSTPSTPGSDSTSPSTGSNSDVSTPGSSTMPGSSTAPSLPGSDTGSSVTPSVSEEVDMDKIYASTKWKKDVVDLMYKYLGKNIIPYIELGSNVIPDIKTGATVTLTLTGMYLQGGITATRINTAKNTYENAGYTVTTTDTEMNATLEAQNLAVRFYSDSEILYVKVTYTEPFDPSTASAYSDEIIDDLNTDFGNHATDIPFVYLGTANPTGSLNSDKVTYTITGGKWDDQIVTLAQTAFDACNSSIQAEENKWVYTLGTNSYGKTFKADVLLADGTKFHVEIISQSNKLAKMTIKYTEPFVPPVNGSWPSDIQKSFNDNLGGHAIPYFYMATMAPTTSWIASSRTITILGGVFDIQILSLAMAAFDKENLSIANEDNQWKYTIDGETMNVSVEFEDGCSLSFLIKANTSGKTYLQGSYAPGYIVPDGADWTNKTKTMFNDHLDGISIPYVYLNSTNETSSWTQNTGTLALTGGKWFDKLLPGALAAFQAADGWTASIQGTKMVAEKIIDADLDKRLEVTVCGSSNTTSSNSGSCKMSIVYYTYDAPTDPAEQDWTDTVKKRMTDSLYGHILPFFYLNTTSPSMVGAKGSGYLNITGGLYNKQVISNATAAFASWGTPTIEDGVFSISHEESDGFKVFVTIQEGATNHKIEVKTYVNEKFQLGKATDWDDETKANLKKLGYDLPFIDLGVLAPYSTASTSSNNIYFTTTCYDDSIVTNAKATLEPLGYVVDIGEEGDKFAFTAYQRKADGSSILIALEKQDNSSIHNFRCYMNAYYIPADTTVHTKNDWSDAEKTFINSVTENHADKVPFIHMGEGDYTTTDATATALSKVGGTAANGNSALKAMDDLRAAGYKVKFKFVSQKPSITARYENLEDGYYIELALNVTSSKYVLDIKEGEVFSAPTGDKAKWSDEIKADLTEFLGDDIELPYVYLGTRNVESAEEKGILSIIGGTWDDSIFDLAAAAFSTPEAKAAGWSCMVNVFDNVFTASTTSPSGLKIKVTISKDSSNRPIMKIEKK